MKKITKKLAKVLAFMLPKKHCISFINYFLNQNFISALHYINDDLGEGMVVYDIGAHKGMWTKQLKNEVPSVSPFMFEANPIHESDLKRLGHWYKVGILSDSEKMADFYACGGSGDSLYKEDSVIYEDAIPTKEKCMTLDKVVEEENIPFPDFIKLDTQGSELDVLRGASKCLSHAKLILLECPIYPYNLKAPSMKEYIDFMLDNGLYPSQCTEIHNLNGVLIQIDILFIHQNVFDKVSNRSLSHLKRSKINRVG